MTYLVVFLLLAAAVGLAVMLIKFRARDEQRAERRRKRYKLDPSEKARIPIAPPPAEERRPIPNPLMEAMGATSILTIPRGRGESGDAGKMVQTPDGETILTTPPFALKPSVFPGRLGGYVNGLSKRLPAWVVACPRIRMDSLVVPTPPDGRDPADWTQWRKRVRMRSLDILICDRRDWKPLLAIMLERPAHLSPRGLLAKSHTGSTIMGGPGGGVDRMIEEILGHVGLPLIRATGSLESDWPAIEPYVGEAILRTHSDEDVLKAAEAAGDRPDPDAAVTLLRMDAEHGWLLE